MRDWHVAHGGVELIFVEANDREIMSGLAAHHVDVAIVFTASLNSLVAALPLFEERLVVAVSTGNELASKEAVRWKDIAQHPILLRSWNGSNAYREFEAGLIGFGADFRPQKASYLTILSLVAINEGVCLLTEGYADLGFPDVVFLPVAEINATLSLSLAWWPETEDAVEGFSCPGSGKTFGTSTIWTGLGGLKDRTAGFGVSS